MSCLANDESLNRGAVLAPLEEDKSQIKSVDPKQKHKGKQPYRSVHTRRQVAATRRGDRSLRVYRSATSCSNKVRRHVAATNRFVCTGKFL